MKITKITVGRLHNLGNYEHIRYEITVEVPEGHSPAVALRGVENILNALNPKRPGAVPSLSDVEQSREEIARVKAMSEEEYKNHYSWNKFSKAEMLDINEKQLADRISKREAWLKQQAHARQLCDDVPVAAQYTDAKDNWQHDY